MWSILVIKYSLYLLSHLNYGSTKKSYQVKYISFLVYENHENILNKYSDI